MLFSTINPLIAFGVVVTTGLTDAADVMFTSAVLARKRIPAATWSSILYLLSSFAIINYTHNWLYLLFAIATEVVGTVALRSVDGLSRLVPIAVVVVGYGLSFVFLAATLRELDLGLTYAVWAGLGTAAIALIGMLAFGESMTPLKLVSLVLIIAGVAGLNAAGGH